MQPLNSNNNFLFQSVFEALEERVLFDGVPDAAFILPSDAAVDVPAQVQNLNQADAELPVQLIIVDPGVEDADALLAEILESNDSAAFEVRMLDADADGLQQITDLLAASDSQYDAIHIISHGEPGQVNLGNSELSSSSFSQYVDQLASWSSALTEDADLLFYGCDLAGNDNGRSLIESISAVTGADVAASDDLTGNQQRGGDWDLEFTTGAVQTAAFRAEAWDGLLAGNPVPTATLDLPAEQFINEDFDFVVSFDNTSTDSTDVGYAPYIDLSVPPGVDINSASFLGSSITLINAGTFDAGGNLVDSMGDPVDHPLTGLPVTGTAGETLFVIEMPFGSFVPDQPIADVTINATLDSTDGAVVGVPLDIDATGGFALGSDPQDNAATDPPITGATHTQTITPAVIDLIKEFDADDNIERATGPNYPITYSLVVDIADGETVTNIDVRDFLPNSFVYIDGSINVDSSNATAASAPVFTELPNPGAPRNAPDNDFLVEFASVTGSDSDRDIVIEYTVYVSNNDADGNPVIDAASGDDVTVTNDSSVEGTYNATNVGDDGPETDLELEQRSIAVQKGLSIVNDTGGAGATPGDTLEYTITVQISDYFEFSNITLDDNFTDGQDFDTSFVPTFVINEGGSSTSGTFAPGNFSVTPGAAGSEDVFFDISAEVADGTLTGDLFADSVENGASTVTVTFRTVIQDTFESDFPSGDQSVDIGDQLSNTVTVSGTLPSGQTEQDTGGASISIQGPSVTKEVYAIDGVLFSAGDEVTAGLTTTYRFQMTLPTSDVENLVLTDYLPLPFYDALEVTTFDTGIAGATPPPAGVATFGPNHTLDTVVPSTAGGPTLTPDGVANSIAFDFGTFDVDPSASSVIDILFTVTGQDVLMADGLTLNNQVLAEYGTTNQGTASSAALAPITVAAPELVLTKGVVATTAVAPTFTPSTVGPVGFNPPGSANSFGGGINSANLTADPIDSNLADADAGDLVTFAVVIENTGGADAYDLNIQDVIPPEYLTPGSGHNVQVRDGDGNAIAFTGDLFGAGIEITDPASNVGAINNFDDAQTAGDGSNIIVITYDVELAVDVGPDQTYTNTAELAEFSALDGGSDHTDGSNSAAWEDIATVDTPISETEKTIVATSEAHTGFVSGFERVTIGEIVRYRLVAEIPEVTVDNFIIQDLLPAGLQFINDGTSNIAIISDGNVTSTSVGGLGVNVGSGAFVNGNESDLAATTPAFTLGDNNIGSTDSIDSNVDSYSSGDSVYFKLGRIQNADNDADKEFVVIEFNALVLNSPGSNDNNDQRDNSFTVQNGSTEFGDTNVASIRITEPSINDVTKTATPTTGDAGDVVTFTVTFSNSGAANRSDAFNVNMTDNLPAEFALIPSSVTAVGAGGTTGIVNNSNADSVIIDVNQIPNGGSITIQYDATLVNNVQPGEVISNLANVTYSSLPVTGTVSNPTGSDASAAASGADDGERDGSGSGVHNDYSDSDTAQVTVFAPTVTKSLISTSVVSGSNTNDQAVIGEEVTYEVVITIPEGVINDAELIDTLDLGLSFVRLDSISASLGVTSDLYDLNDETTIPTSTSGQEVTFDLGTITNSNNDPAGETITIRYTTVVDNIVDTQSGDGLDNSVQLSWMLDGTTPIMSNADDAEDVQIIEPELVVNKSASAASADAGDPVTFTITLGHTGTSQTDAFDVTFNDPVPPEINWNLADITATHSASGDISSLFQKSGNTLETIPGSSFDILQGETVTITIDGTVAGSITPGQEISNTANAQWTSIDGVDANERGGNDGEGGALDDYADTSTAALTVVGSPTLAKNIVGTGINTANNDDTEVVIGETVQYRLLLTLPEATIPNSRFIDNLDLGLEFVSLDSVTAFSGAMTNPATVTSTVDAFTNTSAFDPTITGDGTATAQNLTFDFGTLVNQDNDNSTTETLEIIYTVRVTNIPSNTSNGSAAGQSLNNVATFNWEDASGDPFATGPANAANVEVIEPELNITKLISDATPHLGQTVDYTITIDHTANSDADAHDLRLTDLVPSGMTLDLSSINVVGATIVSDVSTGNTIDLTLDELAIGDTITLTYEATVTNDATQIGSGLDNTANTTWSSLPDGNVAGTTERDGDGGNAGEDDYTDSVTETAVLTHPQVNLVKTQVGVAPAQSGTDGNVDITYEFTINSTGNDPLTSVSLLEDLATQYGGAFVRIVPQSGSPSTITSSTATDAPELNTGFNGGSDTEIFDNSGANTSNIGQGQSVTVRIIIEVDPNAAGANLNNGDLVNQAQVTATGDDTGVVISDLSDDPTDGTDTDTNGNNNPDDPNRVRFPNISLQKQVSGSPVPADSGIAGNYDVTYALTITNTGSTALDSLVLNENLAAHFGGAFIRIVPQSGAPAVITASDAADDPGISAAFDGTAANQNIFDGSPASLLVNQSITVRIVVELDPDAAGAIYDGVSGDGSGDFENQAYVSATDSGDPGTTVDDNSDDPTDGDDASDDADNDPDSPTGLSLSDITLVKTQFGSVVPATSGISGNFEVTYDLAITNTGDQALNSLSLIEDLQANYGGGFVRIVPQSGAPATIVSAAVSDDPEINSAFDGTTANSQLFDNSGANTNLLDVGETVTVRIVIEVDPDNATAVLVNGALENQATTSGTGVIDGSVPTDQSDDPSYDGGNDPDLDNNPDDPNQLSIAEIELEKSVTGTPVIASSGTFGNFDITYTFEVTNTGSETLSNISLVDDLATQLGGVFVDVVSVTVNPGTATNAPAANGGVSGYDGTAGSDMLIGAGTDELRPRETFTVTLVVEIDPNSPTANYTPAGVIENSATTTADGENGGNATDISDDPTDAADVQDPADPSNDPDDPTPLYVPSIGLVKAASDAVANGENFDVTFTLLVENNGTVDLNNLSLLDDVAAQFGNAYVSSSGLAVQNFTGSGSAPGANGAWNGDNTLDMLDGTGQLNIGDSFEVVFTVTVDPDGVDDVSQALNNQANVTGDALDENGNPIDDGSGGTLSASDVSDNGVDPNSENGQDNGDGTPGNDPTPVIIADISVVKDIVGDPVALDNGNFSVTYELIVENTGTINLENLSLVDNLPPQFGTVFVNAGNATLVTPPTDGNSNVVIDSNWDGNATDEMIDQTASTLLVAGDSYVVRFTVEVDPDAVGAPSPMPIENQVTTSGDGVDENGDPILDSTGTLVTTTDLSDDGTDPNGDNAGSPGDHGTTDDPTPLLIPDVGLAKTAGDAVANGDNFDVTFTLVYANTGTVALDNLALFDDVAAQFGNAFVSASNITIQNFSGTGTAPVGNANWRTDTTQDMLVFGQLDVGDSFEVVFTVTIDPDGLDSVSQALDNQAIATADGLNVDGSKLRSDDNSKVTATDVSDDGTDVSGENGTDDGDGVVGNDPTPIIIADIRVVKDIVGDPVALDNGNFSVNYQLVIENTGTIDLENLSLVDNLPSQLGTVFVNAGNINLVTPPTDASSNVVLDSNWDGDATSEMIDQTASTLLAVGDSYTVSFTVEVDPDAVGAPMPMPVENQVNTSGDGVDENGNPILDSTGTLVTTTDLSDDGTDPNGDNAGSPGDHGTTDDPTPLLIPDVGLAKTAGDAVANGDNFEVPFTLVYTNTGTVALDNLVLVDDVAAQFGNAFVSASNITIQNFAGTGTAPVANANWRTDTTQDMLVFGQLDVGDSFEVVFTVTIDPDGLDSVSQALANQAIATADGLNDDGSKLRSDDGTIVTATDVSDDGTDVSGENGTDDADGVVGNDPTPIIIADIGVAKSVVGNPTLLSNGNYEATYQLVVENIGTVDLANLSLVDDIATQFGAQFVRAYDLAITTGPADLGSTVTLADANWDGSGNSQMIDAGTPSLLAVGDTFVLEFKVEIDPDAGGTAVAPLENQVTANGDAVDENGDLLNDAGGNIIMASDQSDDGTDPSTDNAGSPGDHGTTDDPTPVYIPAIGLAKSATDAVANGDNWDVTFAFRVENTGTVDLNNLNLVDDVAADFGNAFVAASGLSVENFVGAGTAPGANSAWQTDTSANMVDGTGQLNVGDYFDVMFTITIDPDGIDSVSQLLNNQGTITGDALDENGDPIDDGSGGTLSVTDVSDNGVDPNGENGQDNGDGTFANDPTPVIIADVSVTKETIGQPALLANGNFAVTYQLVVENVGTVDLADMTLVDDIQTQFGASVFQGVSGLTMITGPANSSSGVTLDAANWDGTAATDMLDQTATNELAIGDAFTVQFVVEVDAVEATGVLENQVTVGGTGVDADGNPFTDASGNDITASDDSDSGSVTGETNPDELGDTGGSDDPTPTYIPNVGLAKLAGDAVANGDNFDVTFRLNWENTGNTDLTNLTMFDDIAAQFGNAFVSATGLAVENFTGTGTAPVINSAWTGDTTQTLITGGTAGVGDSFDVVFTVTIDPDGVDGVSQTLENQATTQGDALDVDGNPLLDDGGNAITVNDDSDNGTETTGDNGQGSTEDPTPIYIADLGIAKSVTGTPEVLFNGNSVVTFQVIVENTGTVDMGSLSLVEDLATQFGDAFVSANDLTLTAGPSNPGSSITLDTAGYDGASATDLLDQTVDNVLAVGDSFTLEFSVVVDPDGASGTLGNQVVGTGDAIDENGDPILDANGDPISGGDLSDSGTDPGGTNPDQEGDTGTGDDPSPFTPTPRVPAQISGSVFEDNNNDGVRDANEAGIEGVEVTLIGTDVFGNAVELTTLTDANGDYSFQGLNAGNYRVVETQPDQYDDGLETSAAAGSIADNQLNDIVLGFGQNFQNNNFGEIRQLNQQGTSGNPARLPPLGVFNGQLLSNRISGFLGGPGPIYSGVPIASNGNPLTLQSGRPVTGGYASEFATADPAVNVCDPCSTAVAETPVVETPVVEEAMQDCGCDCDCDCGTEVIEEVVEEAQCQSCEAFAPCEDCSDCGNCCDCGGQTKQGGFLFRFRNWLNR